MRTCFTAPASTKALSVFSSIAVPVEQRLLLGDRDAQVLAVAPNENLYQIGDTPMLVECGLSRRFLNGGINAEVQGRCLFGLWLLKTRPAFKSVTYA